MTETTGKRIVLRPLNGLCNRLRAIASAYSIAKKNGYALVVCWVPDEHCMCRFADLYEHTAYPDVEYIDHVPPLGRDYVRYVYYTVEGGNNLVPIDTRNRFLYVESHARLVHADSHTFFDAWMSRLKPVERVRALIESQGDLSKCVGLHVRMEGGEDYSNSTYDSMGNMTAKCGELMTKYRRLSHVDRFVALMLQVLSRKPDTIFFVAADRADTYAQLRAAFGSRVRFIARNVYDRSLEQLQYAAADLACLARCAQLFGSYWSSYSEIAECMSLHKRAVMSTDFEDYLARTCGTNVSVIQGVKNRAENLVRSVRSYINSAHVDDVVIVDFQSDEPVYDVLLRENLLLPKVRVVRIDTPAPWILSWAYNIGLLFCKNHTVLKLDADVVVRDDALLASIRLQYDRKKMYTCDWRKAADENEMHLNGIFVLQMPHLLKHGFFHQHIMFYGWDDDELKERMRKGGVRIEHLPHKHLQHIDQTDAERLTSQTQNAYTDFFGFSPRDIHIHALTFYNRIMTSHDTSVFHMQNCASLFVIRSYTHTYTRVELCARAPQSNCNYNPLSERTQSICIEPLFKRLMYEYDVDAKGLVKRAMEKHPRGCTRDFVRLYYALNTTRLSADAGAGTGTCAGHFDIVVAMDEERDIARRAHILLCLAQNAQIACVRRVHVLWPGKKTHGTFVEMMRHMATRNDKIAIVHVPRRVTYNDAFAYANKNIKGRVVLTTPDIVYDETLRAAADISPNDFVVTTCRRRVVRDGTASFDPIAIEGGAANIFSQSTWIFCAPTFASFDADVHVGAFYSDTYLAYLLKHSQYKCYNMYDDIVCRQVRETDTDLDADVKSQLWMDFYHKTRDANWACGITRATADDLHKKRPSRFVTWSEYTESVAGA